MYFLLIKSNSKTKTVIKQQVRHIRNDSIRTNLPTNQMSEENQGSKKEKQLKTKKTSKQWLRTNNEKAPQALFIDDVLLFDGFSFQILTFVFAIFFFYHQIELVENCRKLRTLVVRDTISTSTLLVLATYGSNLERLYVRRNALRKRFDFSDGFKRQWNDTFIQWLAKTSKDYESTFAAVSEKLGYQWRPLNDWQFKRLRPDIQF